MTGETARRQFLQTSGSLLVGNSLLTNLTRTSTAEQTTEEWAQFGYDDANTGYAPTNTGPVENITEQWRFETGNAVISSPAVVDGTVYVGSQDGNIYALDASAGTEQWRFGTSDEVDSSPAVVDGNVYVGSDDGNVYALNAADGSQRWQFKTGSKVGSSPAVVDGIIYVGSWDANVYALDASDGTEQWRFETNGRIVSSPAVVDGNVYVGSDDGNVYALDALEGTEQWRFETGNAVFSSPAVVDGTIYVGSKDTNVYALDALEGTEQWRYNTGEVFSSPAVVDGTVYVGGRDRRSGVYALDAPDDTEQWRFETGNRVWSRPVVVDRTVYVGSNDTNVYALDASDGTEQWRFETGARVSSSPAVVDGTVYVGSKDGNVYAISEKTDMSSPADQGANGTDDTTDTETPNSTESSAPTETETEPDDVEQQDGQDRGNMLPVGLGLVGLLGASGATAWWMRKGWRQAYDSENDDGGPTGDGTKTARSTSTGTSNESSGSSSSDFKPSSKRKISNTTTVTGTDQLVKVLSQLRQGDEITYEASGGGRKGEVNLRVSEVGESEGTYCIFGKGKQDGEYALFPEGRPSGQKYDPPEACYIRGPLEPPLSSMELLTHGTIQKLHVDNKVINRSDGEKRETRRQQLQNAVAALRSALDQAEKLATEDSLADAQSKLETLEPNIIKVEKKARKHDFDDLSEEIKRLERRRRDRLKEITERIQARTIPDEIPHTPSYSVDYNALTHRESIGAGGNADVSKAVVSTPDGEVTVAVKEPRMSGTLHIDTIEQILDEAETWQQLDSHDNIVGIVDYGSEPLPWIAMEYMDGGHLGMRVGEMDVSRALWTTIAVVKGVRHAHRHGVAHLDLKPQNILFRKVEGAWDVPKVADFGLSKELLNHSKSVDGFSPQYAAPEQFDDDHGAVDDITDVYQLGAVFYELFTGQPPFEGQPFKVMEQLKTEQPTPPSELADIPPALDDILLTALAKEKDDRYESVLLLRNDLQELFEQF